MSRACRDPSPLRPRAVLLGTDALEPFEDKAANSQRADNLPQLMSRTAGSRAQDPSRRRILIVEDDYLVALQFENALTEAGRRGGRPRSPAGAGADGRPPRRPA